MQEDAQGSHGGKHNMIKIDQNFSTLDASIGAIRRTPTHVHNRAVVDGCGWCPHMRAVHHCIPFLMPSFILLRA